MSWLCNFCGYENEYSDEEKLTTCMCCGEPATEEQLAQAQRDLDRYHEEQIRLAKYEEQQRRLQERREKREKAFSLMLRLIKNIRYGVLVCLLAAVVLVGLRFLNGSFRMETVQKNVSECSSLSAALQRAPANISLIGESMAEKLRMVKANAAASKSAVPNSLGENISAVPERLKAGLSGCKSGWELIKLKLSDAYEHQKENFQFWSSQVSVNYDELVEEVKNIAGRVK